jgi:hypothetical protein
MRMEFFAQGEEVITIGDIGDEMYFICSGAVEVVLANGKRIAVLNENQYFGEIALLRPAGSQTRNATVRLFLEERMSYGSIRCRWNLRSHNMSPPFPSTHLFPSLLLVLLLFVFRLAMVGSAGFRFEHSPFASCVR